jgi:hypothetical protein
MMKFAYFFAHFGVWILVGLMVLCELLEKRWTSAFAVLSSGVTAYFAGKTSETLKDFE